MRYFLISSTLLVLSLAFLLTSCDFEPPKPTALPAKTTEGLNTFGCEVDNNLWVPWRDFYWQSPPKKLSASGGVNRFQIAALHEGHRKLENIWFRVMLPVGDTIQAGTTYNFAGMGFIGDPNNEEYQTHATGVSSKCYFGGAILLEGYEGAEDLYSEGWIRFSHYDLQGLYSGTASGEFEFTMEGNSEACGNRVVTKGRFDVRF